MTDSSALPVGARQKSAPVIFSAIVRQSLKQSHRSRVVHLARLPALRQRKVVHQRLPGTVLWTKKGCLRSPSHRPTTQTQLKDRHTIIYTTQHRHNSKVAIPQPTQYDTDATQISRYHDITACKERCNSKIALPLPTQLNRHNSKVAIQCHHSMQRTLQQKRVGARHSTMHTSH